MGDVRWMFHATAMGPDYDAILGPLERLFGCRVLHRQQLEEPVGRDGGMTWIGDNSIEIGSPYGEGSSVAKFVERLGGGMHSFAVQVDDLPATLRRIEPLGVEVAVRLAPDLAFTRPGGTAGLVIEWGSHVQDDDPRFGAPVPVFVVLPVVNVELMAFVAALVRDPRATASGSPRCSTPTWWPTTTGRHPTYLTSPSTWATACSRSTRYRPTRPPAARSGVAFTTGHAA